MSSVVSRGRRGSFQHPSPSRCFKEQVRGSVVDSMAIEGSKGAIEVINTL